MESKEPAVIQIYKSLDRTNSFFGLVGSYQRYFIFAMVGEAMLCFGLNNFMNGLLCLVLFVVMLGATYLATRYVQSKYSDKQRSRWMCSHKLPDYIVVKPVSMRRVVESSGVSFKKKK